MLSEYWIMKSKDYLIKSDFVYREANPMVALSAIGSTLSLQDGRVLVDLEAANGTALFGYDSTLVDEAGKFLKNLPMIPSFFEAELRIKLAERFCNFIHRSTGEWGRVAFELGGAQGIELAIKLASRVNPNKRTILVLDGCYHGRSLTTANLSCSLRYSQGFNGSQFNIVRIPVPGMMKGDIAEQQAYCRAYIDSLFADERCGLVADGNSDILCFIYEPVLNVSGLLNPGKDYLQAIIEKTKQSGGLVIADEIFTGLYRLGAPVASLQTNTLADFMVFSKIITNGITPLSVVWGKQAITSDEIILPGLHSSTFGNSLFAFSIANLVLDKIENISLSDVNRVNNALQEMCKMMVTKNSYYSSYDVDGLTAKITLCNGVEAKYIRSSLSQGVDIDGIKTGVLTAYTGLAKSQIMMHPPINISDSEIEQSLKVLQFCQ